MVYRLASIHGNSWLCLPHLLPPHFLIVYTSRSRGGRTHIGSLVLIIKNQVPISTCIQAVQCWVTALVQTIYFSCPASSALSVHGKPSGPCYVVSNSFPT